MIIGGWWKGLADEVAINLLAVEEVEPRANTVTLIAEEVHTLPVERGRQVFLSLVLKGG